MNNTNLNNLKALKRCRKLETLLFLLIVFPTAVPIVFSFIAFFGDVEDEILFCLDGFIFKFLYSALAFMGLYGKKNLWAVAAPVFQWGVYVCFFYLGAVSIGCDRVLCISSMIVAVGTVFINRKYAYLEQKEGFPYFNERFEKQKVDYNKFNEKNPFATAAEEREKRRKTASDKMDDLF